MYELCFVFDCIVIDASVIWMYVIEIVSSIVSVRIVLLRSLAC